MKRRLQNGVAIALGMLALLSLGGCTYMRARGGDALDMVDLGVSVTTKACPDLALYIDFFDVMPIGYSTVNGRLLGIGNRQAGWLEYESKDWGVLAFGKEKHGAGWFNIADPYQARPDQKDLTERPVFDVGFVGAFTGDNPPPSMQHIECNRMLHLGWVGIVLNLRPAEMLDFVLGWTTFDLTGDDELQRSQPERKSGVPEN